MHPKRFVQPLVGWLRYLAERFLILPAAACLPRAWALRAAEAAGWIEALLPLETSRVARREMRAALGGDERQHRQAVAEHLAWPRRDLVRAKRLRRSREHPRDWRVSEVNGEAVQALRARGDALLIVSGHFSDIAPLALTVVLFPDLAGRTVAQQTPQFSWSPAVLRTRMVNGLLYGLPRLLTDPGRETQFPRVDGGQRGIVEGMAAQLRQPHGIARLLIDAYWEKEGAHRRPFAGIKRRGFALGAARVARLAQCHVVCVAPIFVDSESVVVDWGTPMLPPPIEDEAADIAFTDRLIDELERLVGRYPVQYLHPIGWERRWNAASATWQEADSQWN